MQCLLNRRIILTVQRSFEFDVFVNDAVLIVKRSRVAFYGGILWLIIILGTERITSNDNLQLSYDIVPEVGFDFTSSNAKTTELATALTN